MNAPADERFQRAVAVVLEHEGGFTAGLHDPGGPTKYGISLRYLKRLGVDLDGDGDVDERDIRAMTREQAVGFYRVTWWDPGQFERIRGEHAATKLFDAAVNVGPGRADRLAFLACGLVPGDIRWPPVDHVNAMDPARWVAAFCAEQARFYRHLVAEKAELACFLAGWLRRAAWPLPPSPSLGLA